MTEITKVKIKRILIDADACPVVNIAAALARKNNLECILVCDTSHYFSVDGAQTMVVSKGADSVDFALVNLIVSGDVVVTQDYGLASMCLARRAVVIHQDGWQYTAENIDLLLAGRHAAKQARMSGQRIKGFAKRKPEQNEIFRKALADIIGFF